MLAFTLAVGVRRWSVVAAVAVVAILLGQAGLAATAAPVQLGVEADVREGGLVVTSVQTASVAWTDGVRDGDRITHIDDRPVSASEADAVERVESARSLTLLRPDGSTLTSAESAPASPLAIPSFLVATGLFLVVGGAVFLLSSDIVIAAVVLSWTAATATMLLAAVGSVSGAAWALALTFVSLIGFGAATFLVALVFPVDRLKTRLGWRAAQAVGVTGLGLVGWYIFAAVSGDAYAPIRGATFAVVVVFLLAAAGLLAAAFLSASPDGRAARRAGRQLALGASAGLIPFCALSLGPYTLGLGFLAPPELTILAVVLFPIALGGAVLSRQFLAIDRLVNRSLIAVIVWLGLLGIYVVGVSLAAGGVATDGEGRRLALVAAVAVTVATFPLLQGSLRRRLERMLFRDLYDPAVLVRQLGDQLLRVKGLEHTAQLVLDSVCGALDLKWIGLRLTADAAHVSYACGCVASKIDFDRARLVQLMFEGEQIGVLALGPKQSDVDLLPSDMGFIDMVRPMVSAALQNALLVRRLEAQVLTLAERERALAALNARFFTVAEESRRELALDLHDDALQQVVLLARQMGGGSRMRAEELYPWVDRWREAAQDIAVALRAICRDLRPPMLDDLGLGAAVDWLATDVRTKSELDVDTDIDDVGQLDPGLAIALYRVAQESLNNVRKHAGANTVTIALHREDGWLRLHIADDGKGIEPSVNGQTPGRAPSLGLLGMRERVSPWGGTIRLTRRPTGGTLVTAEVPLASDLSLAA